MTKDTCLQVRCSSVEFSGVSFTACPWGTTADLVKRQAGPADGWVPSSGAATQQRARPPSHLPAIHGPALPTMPALATGYSLRQAGHLALPRHELLHALRLVSLPAAARLARGTSVGMGQRLPQNEPWVSGAPRCHSHSVDGQQPLSGRPIHLRTCPTRRTHPPQSLSPTPTTLWLIHLLFRFSDVNKLRRVGFQGQCLDSGDMLLRQLQELREQRVIP